LQTVEFQRKTVSKEGDVAKEVRFDIFHDGGTMVRPLRQDRVRGDQGC